MYNRWSFQKGWWRNISFGSCNQKFTLRRFKSFPSCVLICFEFLFALRNFNILLRSFDCFHFFFGCTFRFYLTGYIHPWPCILVSLQRTELVLLDRISGDFERLAKLIILRVIRYHIVSAYNFSFWKVICGALKEFLGSLKAHSFHKWFLSCRILLSLVIRFKMSWIVCILLRRFQSTVGGIIWTFDFHIIILPSFTFDSPWCICDQILIFIRFRYLRVWFQRRMDQLHWTTSCLGHDWLKSISRYSFQTWRLLGLFLLLFDLPLPLFILEFLSYGLQFSI